ncbi:MAG TPA: ABC transporter ATP-binding protein [Gammaproteobacteria bacterium]|nr:ABC transporter ATP-binding protein [Gammaproteobacteria bacterium]
MTTDGSIALETRDLSIQFGGHAVLEGVSCGFERGSVTAIVGPNGAGKTTFFNLISGQLRPDSGQVLLFGHDVTRLSAAGRARRGIGRAFQLTNLFPQLTVLENMRLATAAGAHRVPGLFRRADADTDLLRRAYQHLAQVSLTEHAQDPAAALSHGDQRKLEVGLLLALEPRVFMFDEPTSGMSLDEVPLMLELIGRIVRESRRTVLLVEHKMDVIHSLAGRIVVLHQGSVVADGPPAEVMASAVVRDAYLGTRTAAGGAGRGR